MIKKLQKRFIRISLIALSVAMVLVVLVVNAANWVSVRNELQETLSFLAENGGSMARDGAGGRMMGKTKHARNLVSESSWFSVSFDAQGARRGMNLLSMTDPDEQTAADLAVRAVAQGAARSAFLQDYLYLIRDNPGGGQTAVFLNCETKLAAVRTLALISGVACLCGILLAWLLVSIASRRAVAPTIRNMEQQKQFITNASHELKTPLTVIATNMELMRMETPGSPWVASTQKQTAQMRRLVDELVYLSRMEEENAPMAVEALSLNGLLREAAEPFAAMAEYQGRELTVEDQQETPLRGDRASIQRLISILLDNAVKYVPEGGRILASARTDGRFALLTVANDVEKPLSEEQCRQLFDRFYRADPSRNKDRQSGFGIGLAIAAAIVEKHGGSISASMDRNNRLVFTCRLPRGGKIA